MICTRCNKARQPRERLEHKDGKAWLIEFCHHCGFNFEITEWGPPIKTPLTDTKKENPKPKSKRFGAFFRDDTERRDED